MKPTREQCLKWAEEAGFVYATPKITKADICYSQTSEIEALCQRVWNEAIEAAAIECCFAVGRDGREFARDTIRKLKEKP